MNSPKGLKSGVHERVSICCPTTCIYGKLCRIDIQTTALDQSGVNLFQPLKSGFNIATDIQQ